MITILIFAIIGVAIVIYNLSNARLGFDIWGYIAFSLWSFIAGACAGVLVALILPADLVIKEQQPLILESLQDNSSVSGSFFLGSGHFEGEMKYVFYYRDKDLYRMNSIKHAEAAIRYTEGEPRVRVFKESATESIMNWFALDKLETSYIIEVPKGTIKNNYNLDAQ